MFYTIIIVAIFAAIVVLIVNVVYYNQTTYHKITGNSYLKVYFDIGAKGEFEIFRKLRFLEKRGCRFLFNVYLPRENDETTECDVLLIAPKGIVVFESKNYSGWIFGNEKSRMWTQTLPQGKGKSMKQHFFNPIMQNALHIKELKKFIGSDIPVYSVIAFSERCVLKEICVSSSNVKVINRYDVVKTIGEIFNPIKTRALTHDNINHIYDLLYPLSQVDDRMKQQHIENIKQKMNKKG